MRNLPEEVVNVIADKSNGNPYYAHELALDMKQSGVLTINEADQSAELSETAGDLEETDLPSSLQGVISSRIDQLSASTLLTLKICSTFDQYVGFSFVWIMLPSSFH